MLFFKVSPQVPRFALKLLLEENCNCFMFDFVVGFLKHDSLGGSWFEIR
jgi:hypothetical protein